MGCELDSACGAEVLRILRILRILDCVTLMQLRRIAVE